MDEYISRAEAMKACDDSKIIGIPQWNSGIEHAEERLRRTPAADVVEVVRCGQCKHCVEHYDTDGNAPYLTCKEWDSGTDYDGYCHYGERKDGGRHDEP